MMKHAFLDAFVLLALSTRWCNADGLHGLLRNIHARNRNVPVVAERGPFTSGEGRRADRKDVEASDLAETHDQAFWEGRLLMFQSMATSPPTVAPIASPSSTINPSLAEYCQDLEEINVNSSSTACACVVYSDGVVGVNCFDGCTYCDDSGLSCGTYSTMGNFTDTFEIGLDSSQTFYYDGAGGIYGSITFDIRGCDSTNGCGECTMFMNSSQCNSCEICSNGDGVTIDCENLVEGSSFSVCHADVIQGVFQGFAYDIVSCVEPPPLPSPPPPPPAANDNCTNAVMLQIGDTITGTSAGAYSDSIPSCSMIENLPAGVWYTFQGNGSPVLVSTCLGAYNDELAATYVSVYQGSSCGQLECLPTSSQDLTCGGPFYGGSSIAMDSSPNVTYYVHISKMYDGSYGEFPLSVSPYVKPNNDQCSKAGEITVDGAPVRGTMSESVSQAEIPISPCGSIVMDIASGAAWYHFTPTTNATLRASTCSSGTAAMSTGLTVGRGDCDGQTCLAEAFPFSFAANCGDGGSFVDFDVVADGSNYYVAVWGPIVGDLGFFELDIRSLNPPENDDCEAAVGLTVDGPIVTGTLFDSKTSIEEQFSLGSSCFQSFDVSGGLVWYSFAGTGGFVSANSCSDVSSHYIFIYEGECDGSLKCLAYPSSVPPEAKCGKSTPAKTIEGVTYYILVSHSGGILSDSGSFELSVKAVTPPTNSECSGAIELVPDDDTRVVGNTVDEFYDEASFSCSHGTLRSAALWYVVRGTGETMRADTCSNYTNFDTVISILEGPCGVTNSTCLVWNFDSCGTSSSSVIWPTEAGVDYYIRVTGQGNGVVGEFGLRLSTFEAATNDACSGAIELTKGATVSASTAKSSPEEFIDCFFDPSTDGIWYYVDGLGSPLVISTCDPAGNGTFFGRIQVFQGTNCASGLVCTPFVFGDDCSSSWSASVKFFAEQGERYYILFIDSWDDGSEDNNFTITVTDFEQVSNDVCEGALSIDNSSLAIIGSTEDSLPDMITCSQNISPQSVAPGVWYTVQGTGRHMMATTCSSELTMETSLNVFAGSCDQLSCVAYGPSSLSDSSCAGSPYGSSRVTFQTEVDLTYYVLVAGMYTAAEGDFGLTVSPFDPPPNDLCSGALTVLPNSGAISGSTFEATSSIGPSACSSLGIPDTSNNNTDTDNNNNLTVIVTPQSPDLWYRVDGTGAQLMASSCEENTTYDSQIEILEALDGTCTTLACVASNNNSCGGASQIEWFATRGKSYFIRVFGSSDNRGQFQLSVTTL
jgi:hypothetical protein